jgi:hypothetical protein
MKSRLNLSIKCRKNLCFHFETFILSYFIFYSIFFPTQRKNAPKNNNIKKMYKFMWEIFVKAFAVNSTHPHTHRCQLQFPFDITNNKYECVCVNVSIKNYIGWKFSKFPGTTSSNRNLLIASLTST